MAHLRKRLLATAAAVPLAIGLAPVAMNYGQGGTSFIQSARAGCNPCSISKSSSNPCAATKAVGNPCAAAKSDGNPCAAAKAPCNPCAARKTANNPCAAINPCAAAIIPEVASTMPVDKIMEALKAPPTISVRKIYSLDEIQRMYEVGSLLQSVEVKSMAFEYDSAEVKGMQAEYLGNVAAAIQKILGGRPDEVFFVAGHADAPGPYSYNLELSRKRALRVKDALINVFGIPEKSLIAAGFGERHPKIKTKMREQKNRRVTVRCITPLVKAAANSQ